MAYHIKHHNQRYKDGVPVRAGDRRYSQDRIRDFYYQLGQVGKIYEKVFGSIPCIISGGVVRESYDSDYTLMITPCSAVVYHDITVDESWQSLPPATITSQIYILVESTEIKQMSLENAINDGVTVNYVVLKYYESQENSRNYAKASGSYAYECKSSFSIEIKQSALTNYEVCLCEFVGDGKTLSISNRKRTRSVSVTKNNFIENLSIERTQDGLVVKSGFCCGYSLDSSTRKMLLEEFVIKPDIGLASYAWCALVVNEENGEISSMRLREIVNDQYFDKFNEEKNCLNMYYLYDEVYGYCRCYRNTSCYRIIAVFKYMKEQTQIITEHKNKNIIKVQDTTKLSIGMSFECNVQNNNIHQIVRGEILEILNHHFISPEVVLSVKSEIDLTGKSIVFSSGDEIIHLIKIEKEPKTFIKSYNHDTQTFDDLGSILYCPTTEIDLLSELITSSANFIDNVWAFRSANNKNRISIECSTDVGVISSSTDDNNDNTEKYVCSISLLKNDERLCQESSIRLIKDFQTRFYLKETAIVNKYENFYLNFSLVSDSMQITLNQDRCVRGTSVIVTQD